MEGLRNTPGFLGTSASLLADINLVVHILMFIMLCLGVTAQLKRKYHWHDRFQIPVVVLNLFFIAFVMIPSFLTIIPFLPAKLGDTFFLVPTIHAFLGLLAQGVATYCLLAGLKILPRKIGVLRYWMWTAFVLWTITTLFGIAIYIIWYTGGSDSGGAVSEHAADLVGEHAAEVVVAPTEAPAEAVAEHAEAPVVVEATTAPAEPVEEHAEAQVEIVEEHAEVPVEITAEPTATPEPPTPTPAPVRVGLLTISDDQRHGDKASLAMTGVTPPPADSVYEAWLQGEQEPPYSLGKLTLSGDAVNHTFSDPDGRNLLALFDRAFISVEPANDSDPAPSGVNAFEGQISPAVLEPLRLAVVGAPDTPNGDSYGLNALNQISKMEPEVGFQKDYSIAENDLAALKIQAEGILNVIEDQSAADFGDRDGSGDVYNPGDGFGLLGSGSGAGYLQALVNQAAAVAQTEGASPETVLQAQQAQTAAENALSQVEQIRDLELQILQAADTPSVAGSVDQVVALMQSLTDADGVDLTTPNQGGIRTAFTLSQLIGGIELFPVAGEIVAPAAAPTAELIDEHAGETVSEHAGN